MGKWLLIHGVWWVGGVVLTLLAIWVVLVSGSSLLPTHLPDLSLGRMFEGGAVSRTSPTCPGTRFVVTLTPSWFELNPGGACRTVVEVTSGNYENADVQGAFPRASVEPRTAFWVRSLTPTAKIEYSLCPRELPEPKLQLGCLPDN